MPKPPPTHQPAERFGDWMQTFTGRKFWPIDPRPDEVDIIDIAHALSMACRYAGHVQRFYSVAEHSVYVSQALPPSLAMWGLLHDASEAYVGDIVRPAKRFIAGYEAVESALMAAICERFGLALEAPPEIKVVDNRIIEDERRQLLGAPAGEWGKREPLGIEIEALAPQQAKRLFLARYREILSWSEVVA